MTQKSFQDEKFRFKRKVISALILSAITSLIGHLCTKGVIGHLCTKGVIKAGYLTHLICNYHNFKKPTQIQEIVLKIAKVCF